MFWAWHASTIIIVFPSIINVLMHQLLRICMTIFQCYVIIERVNFLVALKTDFICIHNYGREYTSFTIWCSNSRAFSRSIASVSWAVIIGSSIFLFIVSNNSFDDKGKNYFWNIQECIVFLRKIADIHICRYSNWLLHLWWNLNKMPKDYEYLPEHLKY